MSNAYSAANVSKHCDSTLHTATKKEAEYIKEIG
jgi:hypothetical protein